VAKADGLTEDMVDGLLGSYQTSKYLTAREKSALHYADLFKQGEHAIDKDEVYDALKKHFSEEEIGHDKACARRGAILALPR
jgi:alkylhydroperoxidase family enzyme